MGEDLPAGIALMADRAGCRAGQARLVLTAGSAETAAAVARRAAVSRMASSAASPLVARRLRGTRAVRARAAAVAGESPDASGADGLPAPRPSPGLRFEAVASVARAGPSASTVVAEEAQPGPPWPRNFQPGGVPLRTLQLLQRRGQQQAQVHQLSRLARSARLMVLARRLGQAPRRPVRLKAPSRVPAPPQPPSRPTGVQRQSVPA